MKRLTAMLIALVLVFSIFTVTGAAVTTYEYHRYTVTDMYGGIFTYNTAAAGYGLNYHTLDGDNYINPLVVVSDESVLTYDINGKDGSIYYVAGIKAVDGEDVITDYMESGLYESDTLTATDLQSEYFDNYDEEDIIVFFHAEGGYLIGIMSETAAKAHDDMITYPGPQLESDKQDEIVAFGNPYYVDGKISYDYTVQNNTKSEMKGYYALLTYHTNSYTNAQGEKKYLAQLHPIEVDIPAGATLYGSLSSDFGEISSANVVWVEFESKSERDNFLKAGGLTRVTSSYGTYYVISGDAGEALLTDTFEITIE